MVLFPALGLANTFQEWLSSHNRLLTEVAEPLANVSIGFSDAYFDGNTVVANLNVMATLSFSDGTTMNTAASTFDLHEDIGTELTGLAIADRFAVSDESETGEPTRYVTWNTISDELEPDILSSSAATSNTSTTTGLISGSVLWDASAAYVPRCYGGCSAGRG